MVGQLNRGFPIVCFSLEQAQCPGGFPGVKVEGTDEGGRTDGLPQSEIDTTAIVSHHPAQKHVDPFCSRAFDGIREVFLRPGQMICSEEKRTETGNGMRGALLVYALKQRFKTRISPTDIPECGDEKERIVTVKRPVDKFLKGLQVSRGGVDQEIAGGIVHQAEKLPCMGDDRLPVAPGKGGRQKPGNLNVAGPGKEVGDADGIRINETRIVETQVLLLKKILYLVYGWLQCG